MRTTSGKEDYLKIIFELNGHENFVSNKIIAKELGVSAPSVSDMLHKLEKDDLVEYVAYQGVKLTQKGREIAIHVIRKHRLAESFLYSALGYSLGEVDKDAEILEHIESETFFERLEQFLNYPEFCPHGGIIPNAVQYKEVQNKTLLDYKEGDPVVIKRIVDDPRIIAHFKQSGLALGDVIVLKRVDAINSIVVFSKDQQEHYMNFSISQMMFVDEHEKSADLGE